MRIPLTKGKFAIVDKEDIAKLNRYKWRVTKNGDNYYAVTTIYNCKTKKEANLYMHRLLLDAKKGKFVDHKNHKTLDNRRVNIRICTYAENCRNSRKRKGNYTHPFKGVDQLGSLRWRARIKYNYKYIHIGVYKTKEQAARAYNKKAKELFGDFYNPNKIVKD